MKDWKPHLPLLLASAALLLSLWQWFSGGRQLDSLQEMLAMRVTQIDQQSQSARQQAVLANEKLRDATSRLNDVEARLATSLQQQTELESLYRQLTQGQGEWLQGEIEHLIGIASQELQLNGNVKAALIALETAAARLESANQPRFLGLRRALTQDVTSLKAQPYLDTSSLSLRLAQLAQESQQLPLVFDLRHLPEPGTDKTGQQADDSRWLQFGHSLWQDIRGLLQIRRIEGEAPVLPPTEAYFVRENLRLRLLSARLSLLQGDSKSYKDDLNASALILQRHYDSKYPAVMAARKSVRNLLAAPIDAPLPDLSASLTALGQLKNERRLP